MELEAQQARDALQAISRAEATARQHSQNNGIVPLVWGALVFACMASFDLVPFRWALGLCVVLPLLMTVWTVLYQRRLPVKPLKLEKPLVMTLWGIYHAAVLMGGMALGTHFWQRDCLPHGEVDAAGCS